jgi:hypothetical protein
MGRHSTEASGYCGRGNILFFSQCRISLVDPSSPVAPLVSFYVGPSAG